MRRIIVTFIAAIFCFLTNTAIASTLTVTDSQVRIPMPGRTVATSYFTLHNNTPVAVSLTGAVSAAFEKAELHQHTMQDGIMRMQRLEKIQVPANGSLVLQPGGLHLMLFNPVQSLPAGGTVIITLSFSNGEELELTMLLTETPRR